MDPFMVETYRYLRDHGKPISQRDAADYAKLRAPQPPSRALLKRVARAQLGKSPRREGQIREYSQPTAETLRTRLQLEFHKRVIADMGGSLTIKPSSPEAVERPYINYVPAMRNEAATDPFAMLDANYRQSRRWTLGELAKVREYQPDMFEIIDNFGSFEAYRKEI